MLKIYGLTGCGPCEIAKLFFKQKGIPFEFLDISQNAEAKDKVQTLLGTPTAGVLLELDGTVEALRGLSIPRLEAWLRSHEGQVKPVT